MANQIPWSADAEAAFNAAKGKLAEAPQLAAPDLMREFVLTTDASEFAVGACLSQENGEGREQPIAFLSKKLTPTETRWATIEREAFAIVWALSKLETWLFGAKIKVVTDHNPLKYLTLTSPSSARLTRWSLALQRYEITISHIKGSMNQCADALSRLRVAT